MRKTIAVPQPVALAAGLLEDGGRALFLVRRNLRGYETVELPCVLLLKGENSVARLSEAFRRQTGIDPQVHEILFERRHNAGSRKRRNWVPALVFRITAKRASVRPGGEFSGYKWIASGDLGKFRPSRNCEWLRG
jgi:hypothetical protein